MELFKRSEEGEKQEPRKVYSSEEFSRFITKKLKEQRSRPYHREQHNGDSNGFHYASSSERSGEASGRTNRKPLLRKLIAPALITSYLAMAAVNFFPNPPPSETTQHDLGKTTASIEVGDIEIEKHIDDNLDDMLDFVRNAYRLAEQVHNYKHKKGETFTLRIGDTAISSRAVQGTIDDYLDVVHALYRAATLTNPMEGY